MFLNLLCGRMKGILSIPFDKLLSWNCQLASMNWPCRSAQDQDKALTELFRLHHQWVRASELSERKIISFIFEKQVNSVQGGRLSKVDTSSLKLALAKSKDCIEKLHDFRSTFAHKIPSPCPPADCRSPFIISHMPQQGSRQQKRIYEVHPVVNSLTKNNNTHSQSALMPIWSLAYKSLTLVLMMKNMIK